VKKEPRKLQKSKELKILPLKSQYILSLPLFLTINRSNFITNSEHYGIYTRHKNDLYLPQTNLPVYQSGVYFSGIKIYNNLPSNIKMLLVILRDLRNSYNIFWPLTPFTVWRDIIMDNTC
jgi:hypothetical protein